MSALKDFPAIIREGLLNNWGQPPPQKNEGERALCFPLQLGKARSPKLDRQEEPPSRIALDQNINCKRTRPMSNWFLPSPAWLSRNSDQVWM